MKKIILPLIFLFSAVGFGQTEVTEEFKRDTAKNELSIGALNLVAFGALDLAYERILTPNTSWAIEGFILALNRDSEDVSEAYEKDASITGKYKYFFGDGPASGFYVNGLAMISTGEYQEEVPYDPLTDVSYEYSNYTDLALGFGLGTKFVAKQGFFLDLSAGIGRNLLSSDSPTIIGQFNVNLGMRF